MWCVKRRWVVSWLVGGRRLGVVEGSISDHGVQGQDAAVGQGENGLAQGGLPWSRLCW